MRHDAHADAATAWGILLATILGPRLSGAVRGRGDDGTRCRSRHELLRAGRAHEGFLVWAHHMYVSGMHPCFGFFFAVSTLVIAVPTAIKVYTAGR